MNAEEMAKRNEILRVVNGSKLYGTSVGSSDDDFIGVCVPDPQCLLGFKRFEQFESLGSGPDQRNVAGDVDLVIYSVQKFSKLVVDGNPSLINLLWVPEDMKLAWTPWADQLMEIRKYVHSKEGVRKFLGYMTSQVKRLKGEERKHTPNRPELVEKYGFDTKFAGHAIRLGLQGLEFARTGKITLPMPYWERRSVVKIRNGEHTLKYILEWAENLVHELELQLERDDLPPHPNRDAAEKIVIEIIKDFWHTKELV